MENEHCPIIIDNGSGFMKSGWSGNDSPDSVIESVVGRTLHKPSEIYIGDEAIAKQNTLSLKYPIEHGIITNWDDYEQILRHILYTELGAMPEEHPLFVAVSIGPGTKSPREKMIQIAFETFNVPAYFTAYQQVLAIYAAGRTTGLVFDSGAAVSYAVPIYEGYALPHATLRMDLAGTDSTMYLKQLLRDKGYEINAKTVRDIKETMLYVACNGYDAELAKPYCTNIEHILPGYLRQFDKNYDNEFMYKLCDCYLGNHFVENWRAQKQYKLPDGSYIELNEEQFQCPEIMFDPSLIGKEQNGMHQLIYCSIRKCDTDIQCELVRNVVICGGNTLFSGIESRLLFELRQLLPTYFGNQMKEIIAPSNRQYSAWLGASILSSLSTFNESWIDRDEYDQSGPGLVHRRCT